MSKGNDFWLDDPEWELLRRRAERRPVSKQLKKQATPAQVPRFRRIAPSSEGAPRLIAARQEASKEVVLSFKLTVPKLERLSPKGFYQAHRYGLRVGVGAAAALLLVFAGFRLLLSDGSGEVAGTQNTSANAQHQAQAAFDPLFPLKGVKDAAGNSAKPEFKYDREKKVLAYITQYNDADLTVSQQKVPDDFKANPARLMSVAESFNATTTVETQKGVAYVHTDDKSGSQTTIFATNEVLVFIRSNKRLDDDEWKTYVNQLNKAE